MKDIYSCYESMSFAELRQYLKDLRSQQKFWYTVPAVVSVAGILLMCSVGWTYYPQVMNSHSLHFDLTYFGIFDWILSLILVLFLPYEKTERKYNYASAIIMLGYTIVKCLFGYFNPLNLAMAVYYYFAAVKLIPVHAQINFIKSLPDYPFPERVELERKREAEAMKFSESNVETKRRMALEEHKKADSMEQLMDALPKKYIEPQKLSRGDFDETEENYTDKLIGEDLRDGFVKPEFEETNPNYKGIRRSEDTLTMERRENIDEFDSGYDGDFDVEEKHYPADDEHLLRGGTKIKLDKEP